MDMGRIDDGAVATVAAALARAQAGAWDVLDAPGGDVYRRTARVLLADDGVRAAFASPAGAPSASVVYRPGVNCRAVYALLGYAWDDLDDDASHEAWRVSEWGGEGKPCEVACSGLMIVLPDGQMAAPGAVITRRGDGWVVTDPPME